MMGKKVLICTVVLICTTVLLWAVPARGAEPQELTAKEMLGKLLFFDVNLSQPAGQACASCHGPEAGFDGIGIPGLAVYQGAVQGRFGNRNPPAAAYAAFSPEFHYDEEEELYVGGQFWDGRAATLAEQAKGPFLNPLEQNMPDMEQVVLTVCTSGYADLFTQIYGTDACDDVEMAYDYIADAIATYESSSEVNQFSSKYDYYLAGHDVLTEQELKGLELFEAEDKGNCAACHPSQPEPDGSPPLFTDFTYDNLGVPKNPDNPFYYMLPEFNPDGLDFVDYGLGAIVEDPAENGKVKVPTLRNVAISPPYVHNGLFRTLREVVDFYNTRDVGDWPPPEVPENVNTDELGDLGLTDEEVEAIVVFMETLTDGYVPPE